MSSCKALVNIGTFVFSDQLRVISNASVDALSDFKTVYMQVEHGKD